MSGIAFNPETMDAIKSEAWWTPVFHLAITTVVAFCLFSRAASKSWFWIGVWIFNLFIGVFFFVLWPLALRKTA
jgi:hypothetical protein